MKNLVCALASAVNIHSCNECYVKNRCSIFSKYKDKDEPVPERIFAYKLRQGRRSRTVVTFRYR